jgi:DNA-binding CsgD family transcriptional regulator
VGGAERDLPPAAVTPLTRRQLEVLRLAATGSTAKQTARILGLSPRTVEGYLAQARRNLGAASTAELATLAIIAGMLPMSSGAHETTGSEGADGGPTESAAVASENTDVVSGKDHPTATRRPLVPAHEETYDARGATAKTDRVRRRPGRPTVMTPKRIEAAVELLGTCTVTEIAERLGISRATVYAHMGTIRLKARLRSRQGLPPAERP